MTRFHLLRINDIEVQCAFRDVLSDIDPVLLSSLDAQELDAYQSISNSDRRKEWCESRRCLRELHSASLAAAHRTLGEHTSLSHSRFGDHHLTAAAVSRQATTGTFIGLGIDVEHRARPISSAVSNWVRSAEEAAIGLRPLDAWLVKEAAFKADTTKRAGALMTDFVVTDFDSNCGTGVAQSRISAVELGFRLFDFGCWRLAVAVAKMSAVEHSLRRADARVVI